MNMSLFVHKYISFGPFLTCLIITFVLIIYLHIIIHHSSFFNERLIKISIISILLILIRMAIPINFPFTYTVYSYHILPGLLEFARYPNAEAQIRIDTIMFFIWLVVTVILLTRFLFRYIHLKKYLSNYYVEHTPFWEETTSSLQAYYNKPLQIAKIPLCISPSVCGLFTPVIILPDTLNLSKDEIKYICFHELAHYQKHHLWIIFFMEIICCIHWWNPFVHLMKKELSLFLELSNDFYLVNHIPGFNILDYASLIKKTAKFIHNSKEKNSTSLLSFTAKSPSVLTTRIHFLLKQSNSEYRPKRYALFLLYFTMFISVSLSFFIVPESNLKEIESNDTSMGVTIEPDNAYILDNGSSYQIYVDGNFFVELDEIPEDFKNLPIYKEDIEGEN